MQVSIIMTVYNQPLDILVRAIESVCRQTFNQPMELLIIDDGSKAIVGENIQTYLKTIHTKTIIRYVKQINQGQASALNRGIKESTGAFITILDADDEYAPSHIVRCFEAINDYLLICSEANIIVDSEADYYVPDKYEKSKSIHINDCIIGGTLFGRREIFEQILFKEIYGLDALFYETAKNLYTNQVAKLKLQTYIYYRNSITSKTSQLKKSA